MRVALLPSPWLTAAVSWGDLPAELTRLGHDVTVVDVAGDVEPAAVSTYARVAGEQLPRQPVLLVAHGAAGPLLPVVAARRDYGVVTGALLLDADLPGAPGESRLAVLHRVDPARGRETALHLYAGGVLPDWTAADLDVPDPAQVLAGVRRRGLAFFTEPVPVPGTGWGMDVPWGCLRTSTAGDATAVVAAEEGRPVTRRGGGHLAALVDPAGVAADLDALARAVARG